MDTIAKFHTLIAQAPATRDKLFYAGLQLFSEQGYAAVGIRQLCHRVGIKESSFYNHYAGKERLLEAILLYFGRAGAPMAMTDVEIHAMIERSDVRAFLSEIVKRCTAVASGVLYRTARQIVLAESFVHPLAAQMAQNTLHSLCGDYTEQVLTGLMSRGRIRPCDTHVVTAEFYYALQMMLDELLRLQRWEQDVTEIQGRIQAHIDYFVQLLMV